MLFLFDLTCSEKSAGCNCFVPATLVEMANLARYLAVYVCIVATLYVSPKVCSTDAYSLIALPTYNTVFVKVIVIFIKLVLSL